MSSKNDKIAFNKNDNGKINGHDEVNISLSNNENNLQESKKNLIYFKFLDGFESINESLATLKEKENYNFDPHNYQSYYNHVQVVGDSNFLKEHRIIYKENNLKLENNMMTTNEFLNLKKISKINKLETKNKDEKIIENGLTLENFNTFNIEDIENLRKTNSNIKNVEKDEKMKTLGTYSINELFKNETFKESVIFNIRNNNINIESKNIENGIPKISDNNQDLKIDKKIKNNSLFIEQKPIVNPNNKIKNKSDKACCLTF